MTFGYALKLLISICHMKTGVLADALGYDISYISRWLNERKLPSLKNNSELFENISHFLTENSTEEQKKLMAAEFNLTVGSDIDSTLYAAVLTERLKEIYYGQMNEGAGTFHARTPKNGLIVPAYLTDATVDMLDNALNEICQNENSGKIHMIATTPLHFYDNIGNFAYNKFIYGKIKNKVLVVRQFINFSNFSEYPDAYCRRICDLLNFFDNTSFEFYELGSNFNRNSGFVVIKNGILIQEFLSPFNSMNYQLLTRDQELVTDFYSAGDAYCNSRTPIIKRCCQHVLNQNKYFHDFMMMGEHCYLLNVMHLLYMEESFFMDFADRYFALEDHGQRLFFYLSSFKLPKHIVMYKNVLLKYIYEGELLLFDQHVTISQADRIRHLQMLVNFLEATHSLEITLITEDNPLLNETQLKVSIYLGREMVFAVNTTATGSDDVLCFKSHFLESHFKGFFGRLEALSPEYSLHGEDVIAFIRSGIQFLGADMAGQ